MGKYYEFTIYEPKERVIKALPYIDRIVHQWYIEEFIKPYFMPKLISSTFACLDHRGTHKAVDQIEKYMRMYKRSDGSFWILKCDIRKFFYNIDPQVLFSILKKSIQDKALLKFTHLLVFDKQIPGEVGIPIGNYTSQFFANIYLNELDQYIKRQLKVKYYVRYMDDFILLLPTKEACKIMKKKIEDFLQESLHLQLNSKSRYYPYTMGVNFCGYRTFCTHRLLRTSSKLKIKNKIKKWNKQYHRNTLSIYPTLQSLNSWLAHSSHSCSYHLQKKVLNSCHFLYNDSFLCESIDKLMEDSQKVL